MASSEAGVRAAAIEGLRHLGDEETLCLLLEALADDDGAVRHAAAAVLTDRGHRDVVEAVQQALRGDPRPLVALRNPMAIPALVRAARGRHAFVRRAAVQALGHTRDPQAVPVLVRALSDESMDVQIAAIAGLGRLATPEAVDALLRVLRGGSASHRSAAAEALGFAGDARAVEPLVAALEDPDARRAAVGALGRLGALAGAALQPLRALCRKEDDAVHWACRHAISQIEEALRNVPAELQSAAAPPGRGSEPEALDG